MLLNNLSFLLLSNAVTVRRDKSGSYQRTSVVIFLISVISGVGCFNYLLLENGIGIFAGLYQITIISQSFHVFMFLLTVVILNLNTFHPSSAQVKNKIFSIFNLNLEKINSSNTNKKDFPLKIIEYPSIIIFIIIGGCFLLASCDLISLFLSLELQSYGLYLLCAIYRNSERSVTASLIYFLLGALSSCFILLGLALLYSNSGTTKFDNLYILNNLTDISIIKSYNFSENPLFNNDISWLRETGYFFNLSFIVMFVGFLFKVSAAPFHFWSPDVYDAIPTHVTCFVAILTKISLFILFLELVHFTQNFLPLTGTTNYENFSWTIILLISSLFSFIIGSILGLTQTRIKRLYAYSTISHIGFILLALAINTIESVNSFLFYIIQYSWANLNAFFLLWVIGVYFSGMKTARYVELDLESEQDSDPEEKKKSVEEIKGQQEDVNFAPVFLVKKEPHLEKGANENKALSEYRLNEEQENQETFIEKSYSPVQLISQLNGLFQLNPYISLSLAITLFSFVGIPPLIGFFAKQMVISSAIDGGYIFISFVAILTSVISAAYYLVIIKQMFFNPSHLEKRGNNLTGSNLNMSTILTLVITSITLLIIVFILIPNEWLNMVNILTLILFSR